MIIKRCPWCGQNDELYIKYHDEEWGVPVHDDIKHFEFLVLEINQAGLSWKTILKKRDNYTKAYDNFDGSKSVNSANISFKGIPIIFSITVLFTSGRLNFLKA